MVNTEQRMDPRIADIQFERPGLLRRTLKSLVFNPLANNLPPSFMRGLLKFTKSELAAASWKDPGGWRSMVISYDGNPVKLMDRFLVTAGAMPMALRNRRKLAARILAGLIEDSAAPKPAHVLCLGAGPGHIISDALKQSSDSAVATLVDLSSDAFEYGRRLAENMGLCDRMKFVLGDARDIEKVLDHPPTVVKMLGLCEYLTDEQIKSIVTAVARVMPKGTAIVVNSISPAHGTDPFFRRVFDLNMTYRSAKQLQDLLSPAGFGEFQVTAEPLGVYHILVGRRV